MPDPAEKTAPPPPTAAAADLPTACVVALAAGLTSAVWWRVGRSVFGPEPPVPAVTSATLAGVFALGAALSVLRPRLPGWLTLPERMRPERPVLPPLFLLAAAALQWLCVRRIDDCREAYALVRADYLPVPAVIELLIAGTAAVWMAPSLAVAGLAWGLAVRPRAGADAPLGGGLTAAAVSPWIAAAGWAAAVWLMGRLDAGAVGIIAAGAWLLAAGVAVMPPLRLPAWLSAPPTPRLVWLRRAAVAAMALVMLAAAVAAVWAMRDEAARLKAAATADWRSAVSMLRRLAAGLPALAAGTVSAAALAALASRSVLVRVSLPALAAVAAGAWAMATPEPVLGPPPSPSRVAPGEGPLAAAVADWPGKTGRFLLINWEPVSRLPPLPELSRDAWAVLPEIDAVRPAALPDGRDGRPDPRPALFRVEAGTVRDLRLSASDAMRTLPFAYDLLVIGPPPESSGATLRDWTSAEHFARCRRLTAGAGLMVQVIPADSPEAVGAAAAGMAAAFGEGCGVLLFRQSDAPWALLVAGAVPEPGKAPMPVPGNEWLSAAGLAGPVARWDGLWCRPSADGRFRPVGELSPR